LNRSKCHLVKVSYCQTVMLPTTASLKCHNLSMPGAYSQHLIFFVTYEWTQQARVSYYIRMEGLAMDKHSNLGSFTSYEETEVLWIWPRLLKFNLFQSQIAQWSFCGSVASLQCLCFKYCNRRARIRHQC
jgi:hypothetical protein